MTLLITQMRDNLRTYEENAKSVYADLSSDPYMEDRDRFNDKGILHACPSMKNWTDIQVPRDRETGKGNDKFVDQIFWIANELGLIALGQCYEMERITYPGLLIGRREYYKVKFRVKIFFNRRTREVADQITAGDQAAPRLSEHSVILAVRVLNSVDHYTLYDGNSIDVYPRTWTASAAHPPDVYECYRPGINMSSRWVDSCYTNPNRYIPRDQFVAHSTDILTYQEAQDPIIEITKEVHGVLKSIIVKRSKIWDSYELNRYDGNAGTQLTRRKVMSTEVLSDLLKAYTVKYLVAQGLLLSSYYHGNAVGDCLSTLNKYSPKTAANAAADLLLGDKYLSAGLVGDVTSAVARCGKPVLSQELQEALAKLTELRSVQMAH